MKIVVMGGTGLIGKQVVANLQQRGHEAIAASPSQGIDAITGTGLAAALEGAHAVVDVTNSPSYENSAVLAFFTTSTRNLLAAEKAAGVAHHVVLSIVGIEGLPDSGYYRAKVAQEALIKSGPVPYTIVRATQFYEFLGGIADACTVDGTAHLSTGNMQPIAAADVATVMADTALGGAINGTIEIAGPERAPLADLVGRYLKSVGDTRPLVASADAPYFGAKLGANSLTPASDHPRLSSLRFEDWLLRKK